MFPHPSLIALNQRSGAGFPGLTPPFSTVKLLVGFNGTNGSTSFTDESSSARTLTRGSTAQVTTSQLKFGTGSAAFDGTGGYVSAPDSADWQLGAGGTSFSAEGWFRFLVKQTGQALMGQWATDFNSNCAWYFFITGGNLTLRKANGSSTFDTAAAFVPTLGTWYHLAFSLDGPTGVIRIFVNGSMIVKGSLGGFSANNSPNALVIGQITTTTSYSSGNCFNGNIDEVRIVNGFNCYNSDAGFTVPTAAFPRS